MLSIFNVVHKWLSDVVIFMVDFRKFFLDFSLLGAGCYPWSGCLSSFAWAVFWASLWLHFLWCRGVAMPARIYTKGMGVGFNIQLSGGMFHLELHPPFLHDTICSTLGKHTLQLNSIKNNSAECTFRRKIEIISKINTYMQKLKIPISMKSCWRN